MRKEIRAHHLLACSVTLFALQKQQSLTFAFARSTWRDNEPCTAFGARVGVRRYIKTSAWPSELSPNHRIPTNRSPPLFAVPQIWQRLTSVPDPKGRACCAMQWRTSRLLSRLPRLFGARAGSMRVLTDLFAALGDRAQIACVEGFRFRTLADLLSRPGDIPGLPCCKTEPCKRDLRHVPSCHFDL